MWGGLVVELDQWLQKRPRKAIRDYNALREAPGDVLARQTIVLGPNKVYFRAILAAFACTILSGSLVSIPLFATGILPDPNLKESTFWGTSGAAMLFWTLTMNWALRGGHLAMDRQGVHLKYRRTTVFCPWDLFCVEGEEQPKSYTRVCFPIQPAAVDRVKVWRGEREMAHEGNVRTPQFRIHDRTYAELADLYEVNCFPLARLFMELGRKLGSDEHSMKATAEGEAE